jgi:hypothetical protein
MGIALSNRQIVRIGGGGAPSHVVENQISSAHDYCAGMSGYETEHNCSDVENCIERYCVWRCNAEHFIVRRNRAMRAIPTPDLNWLMSL